jgi:uncharacterized membrane protein YjgN (DUF898 family)
MVNHFSVVDGLAVKREYSFNVNTPVLGIANFSLALKQGYCMSCILFLILSIY